MYIEVDGWRSNLRFSACHFIPEYPGAPRVHGYTYTVNVRIHGVPDKEGIVIDFEHMKTKLNSIIDPLDHKVIVPRNFIVKEDNDNIYFEVNKKTYSIPHDEVVITELSIPSAEELSQMILDRLIADFELPKNIDRIELGLDEGWGQGAWSSYIVDKNK
jgi:6-pyruvoyltetrahydropterin/6-carboxytetrahydropterin synthase